MQTGMTEDEIAEIKSKDMVVLRDNEDEKDEEDEEDEDTTLPLYYENLIMGMFGYLETLEFNENVGGAIMYLQKACRLFKDSKRKEATSSRQLLITEMISCVN